MIIITSMLGLIFSSPPALSHNHPAISLIQPVIPLSNPALSLSQPVDTRCALTTGSGIIDYGTLSRGQLITVPGDNKLVTPGIRTLALSVMCPYSRTMRLSLRGEHASNGDVLYGSHGSIHLILRDAQMDGQMVQMTAATSAGVLNGAPASNLSLQPGQSMVATLNGLPVKGKTLTVSMDVEARMTDADTRVTAQQVSTSTLILDLMN